MAALACIPLSQAIGQDDSVFQVLTLPPSGTKFTCEFVPPTSPQFIEAKLRSYMFVISSDEKLINSGVNTHRAMTATFDESDSLFMFLDFVRDIKQDGTLTETKAGSSRDSSMAYYGYSASRVLTGNRDATRALVAAQTIPWNANELRPFGALELKQMFKLKDWIWAHRCETPAPKPGTSH